MVVRITAALPIRACLLFVALAACTPETSVRPDGSAPTTVKTVTCSTVTPTVTVMTLGLAYNPTPTTIPLGGIVQFVMPPQHNVASSTSGLAADFGATTCLQFPTAGTYSFACASHGFMGTVIVNQN